MKKNPVRTLIIAVLLSCSATIVALRWDLLPAFRKSDTPVPAFASAPAGQPALSSEEETNVRVYQTVSPGVVNITSTVLEYDYYYRAYATEGSTGSGCILDKDGHVLTNNHVIESADSLEVTLPDETKYHAEVVGVDRQNDLAVIRLQGAPKERLHPISLGDSDALRVGQKVLAIGNPLGLENTLTIGIVSSLGRRIKTESGDLIDNVIQTDAAINPGSSGGPLLNTAGEMIGINTLIFSIRGGGNIGIGFAIPVNTVRRIASELIQHKRIIRPWFGVEGYALSEDLAAALRLPVKAGILVASVAQGSSADGAGIRGASEIVILYNRRFYVGGDVITEIDGKPVTTGGELRLMLESKRPGDTVTVTLYRENARMQKTVPLVAYPKARALSF